jgi:hypothetical protein
MQAQVQKTGRGIPKSGVRMTKNRLRMIEEAKAQGIDLTPSHFAAKPEFFDNLAKLQKEKESVNPTKHLTDAQISDSLLERFNLLDELTMSTVMGISPSLIVSGSAGIGKTTEIMNVVNEYDLGDMLKVVKGKTTPLSLYKLLYGLRFAGSVLVLDDADDCWENEDSLNIIKAATDSSETRLISWQSSKVILDDDGDEIPRDFIFEGSVIFISNLDIYAISESNNRLAPHFQAMISRSFVLDLAMKSRREYLLRIRHVLFNPNFGGDDMTIDIKNKIYSFMNKELNTLRDVSLRMVKKLHILIKTYDEGWESKAKTLFCKKGN